MGKESSEFKTSYGFTDNEKEILQWWEENDTFKKLKAKNAGGKKYRFIDGPITANNPMGIHHVWGRTLKDTFLRYKAMNGYDNHYRNGFDSQGLWVEVEVEKELGFKTKRDIEEYGIDKFAEKCIERVMRCSGIITGQSKRLGQWMDWENSYYTYKDSNITGIWSFLKKCHDNRWIKKIHRPMPWCPRCGTSLSEHEMSGSYKEIEHEAVFIKLPLIEQNVGILVWTTTPWTLSSNVALAVNPELDYVLVKLSWEEKPLWMGKEYYLKKYEKASGNIILKEVKGLELEGLHYETCFPELKVQKDIVHRIVLWEDVLCDEGCGVVHIAPGCGAEDYELGRREELPAISPIDESGIFYDDYGFLSSKAAKEVKEEVFAELKKRGKLFYTHRYKHSYPICWRCKQEILFRLVDEWAIDVEELRPKLIENAAKVKWNPAYQVKRMEDWLMNMGDWCISRSRFYGLPLPIYECKTCGEITVIGSLEELKDRAVERELVGQLPHLHRPFIDNIHILCPKCGSEVSRIKQVGDVWLDAGIVPFSTLKYFEDRQYWKSYFPAEFVMEMKEQIRLWFYSMLFMSTVLTGEPPYEQVGTHGMVTAEDGTKFSKTGYMIRFDDAADKIGADASRYIFASASMSNDVRFGYNLGTEARKKLLNYYNIAVFFMTYAELDLPQTDLTQVSQNHLDPSDRWLLTITARFIKAAGEYYSSYNTRDVIQLFETLVDDVSNFYIRVNRKRFWKEGLSEDKKVAYSVLLYSLKAMTQVMAPVIPFITEYVWREVISRFSAGEAESVHLSIWPAADEDFLTDAAAVIDSVDAVREMIALSLKIRNEKQLKVKQRLNCAWIWAESHKYKLDDYFLKVLQSEVNVAEVKYADTLTELQDAMLKLNFKKAGDTLKQDVNLVNGIIKALTPSESAVLSEKVLAGQQVKLTEYDKPLPPELFTVEYKEKEHLGTAAAEHVAVALDIRLTDQLKKEGLLRILLRQCQVARRNAGFKVSDKIYLGFSCDSELYEIIEAEIQLLEAELLAEIQDEFIPSYETEFEIEGHTVKVRMSKRNSNI